MKLGCKTLFNSIFYYFYLHVGEVDAVLPDVVQGGGGYCGDQSECDKQLVGDEDAEVGQQVGDCNHVQDGGRGEHSPRERAAAAQSSVQGRQPH